jgi:hypothetical protein
MTYWTRRWRLYIIFYDDCVEFVLTRESGVVLCASGLFARVCSCGSVYVLRFWIRSTPHVVELTVVYVLRDLR